VEKCGRKKYTTERKGSEKGNKSSHSAHANGMNEYQPPELNIKKAMK
jgi:hypothetical protein